jgi:hypothetical protein
MLLIVLKIRGGPVIRAALCVSVKIQEVYKDDLAVISISTRNRPWPAI